MSKIKKNKKIIYYCLSFLIPIIIFAIICLLAGYYPFGDKLLNKYDSFMQYPAMISEFINKIKSGESLFYTFHGALGTNFYTNIAYYTASPFNLLFLFFKNNQFYLCYAIIIMLKLGLSSLTLFYYFNRKYTKNYKINIIFSCIYSLSTWAIALCYQIMWLDALYLAPLILVGIDKLINDNKCKMYIIILTLAIFINFYTAYMLGIFAIIYFIYSILLYKGEKKNKIFKFILVNVSSIFLASVVLLPAGITILQSRGNLQPDYFGFNLDNMKALFYNFLPGSFIADDNYNYSSALIGSSVGILILNILYYFNNKIEKKEKIIVSLITVFFLLSFSFNLLDYGWQMFSKPIWWNSRYAFLFVLFMIIIARKTYEYRSSFIINKNKKSIIILISFLLFTTSFSLKLIGTNPKNITLIIYACSLIFFILMFLIFTSNIKWKNYIIFSLVLFEILFNGVYCLKKDLSNYNINNSLDQINNYHSLLKNIKENDYRIFDAKDSYYVSGLFYNYNSTELFSSIYNNYLNNFYYLIVGGSIIEHDSVNYNILNYYNIDLLSLLNVKYILNNQSNIYNCKNEICVNPYVLPLGFKIKNNKSPKLKNKEVLNNIEKIYSYLYGKPIKLYEDVDINPSYHNLRNKNEEYLSLKNITKNAYVEYEFISPINGILTQENYKQYVAYDINIMVNKLKTNNSIISLKKGDKVKLRINIPKESHNISKNTLNVRLINTDILSKINKEITENAFKIIQDSQYILNGTIYTNDNNDKVFFTIPYDDGLKVYINGKRSKINREFNTFISVNIAKGNNNIKIKYTPKGFIIGLILSIITFVNILAISLHLRFKKKSKSKNILIMLS